MLRSTIPQFHCRYQTVQTSILIESNMSATCILLSLVLNVYFLAPVFSDQINATDTCVQLYEKGVEAYLENNWEDCVKNFEESLEKYRRYRKILQNCRLKCKTDAELSEPLYPVDIDNLLFYERAIRQTLCIIGCENDNPEILKNYNVNAEAEKLFEEQKPYEYLHICYFQMKDVVKAASSAFTYIVEHPEDKVMLDNLKYYTEMDGVEMKDIVNFEAKDYVYLYVHGADAYEGKHWSTVIDNMEESLSAYLQAEEECRAHCEGPFDHGWYPDFIPSISNHFTVSLKCKQKCRTRLGSLNGEIHDDLLPSHYHYLQYAYFKACRAVASYLIFYPDDDTMLENMRYYSKLPKVNRDFFQPRDEAIRYVQRHTYETRLMKFINQEFKTKSSAGEVSEAQKFKFQITMQEKQLGGKKRFVSDGVASEEECRSLITIAKLFARVGDGYDGKKSPHTAMEKFEGITLSRTVFLTYFGLLQPRYLEIYLKVTGELLKPIQEYFGVPEKLYFSYTQLVCRSALSDSPKERTDFSHEIHADNCNILDNGTCSKVPPAFTWRDYSAILYLNDDFEGGEFIFAADKYGSQIQSSIKPTCGRMVAFTSGAENLHGIRAVTKGSRCAIGIWFTHDPNYAEADRAVAEDVLENDLKFHLLPAVDIRSNSSKSMTKPET
ncbi:unnamed protein product [Phaedon cochleariae]|uniref:procollagen-proline 3-dioxygenase n=1 Tax=Phaedon cochleariae TaxID=80249 RepID=A0A9P0DQ41_PHACE|nr:unnamed protein product [Phaedon cochleariae]